ncbi:MAG: Flp family type IVb pilin, partial [Gammaproteobacteria bacterium]
MKTLNTILKAFWQEETGLTMVEYAVAGTLVTLGAVAAFT